MILQKIPTLLGNSIGELHKNVIMKLLTEFGEITTIIIATNIKLLTEFRNVKKIELLT